MEENGAHLKGESKMSEREKEMRQWLGRWKRSGASLKVFGKRHGIAYSTLQYWRGRLKRAGKKGLPKFIPVGVVEGERPEAGKDFSIRLRNGFWIEVPSGYERQSLQSLLEDVSRC